MDMEIAAKIADLPDMSKVELRSLWQENFGQPARCHLRKELMVPLLAYRMQERVFGGLSPRARKKLHEIAQSLNTTSRKRKSTSLQPGTRLIRSWQGVLHQVTVLNSGYDYNGRSYASLSVIAREITRTRWSGPLFFGTKGKAA
jgi:hypothetical protein